MPPGKYSIDVSKPESEHLRCRVSRKSSVTILSLPPEMLKLVLADLYRHNKDWDTDLAFFQASKVNRQFRAIALHIVQTENLDPIRHFLFTRREWFKLIAKYGLIQSPRGYWSIHELRKSAHALISQDDFDYETHLMIKYMILGKVSGCGLKRYLAFVILESEFSASLSSLWRLQRWQMMVGVVRKRAKLLRRMDSMLFRFLRSALSSRSFFLTTSAEKNRRTVMGHVFQDAEWDLVKAMAGTPHKRAKRIYDNVCEFILRWLLAHEVWPVRRRLDRIQSFLEENSVSD